MQCYPVAWSGLSLPPPLMHIHTLARGVWCACLRALAHSDVYACLFDSIIVTFKETTFNNGSLGSCNDEERSKVRYVVRFA
jgi:hypothetical protein